LQYEIRISKKAEVELIKISHSGNKDIVLRIIECFEQLSDDPFRPRPGVNIIQLESIEPKLYRLRVGTYRIMYTIEKKQRVVNVTMVIHRKKAYKN